MPLSTLISNLSGRWKALGLLFSIFSVGLAAGAAAGGFSKIPARVIALEARADTLTGKMSELQQDVAAIRKSNKTMLCLTVAEREHSDWRRCME
jgi:hypothetical protein